jgi:hypothetical protein
MIAAGSLEYALARMHARLGLRPGEDAWRSMEQARGLEPLLELCRGTSVEKVAATLSAASDLHAVDLAIRDGWRRAVDEARAWMPAGYAAALDALRALPLLPAREYLARGGKPAPWMRALADAHDGPPAECDLADAEAAPNAQAWYARWQRLLPPHALADTALADLVRDVGRHLARFRVAAAYEAPGLRRDLAQRFLACFRRHPLEPAAAFAWLGVVALDLERLRGELARRIAFPHARWVA